MTASHFDAARLEQIVSRLLDGCLDDAERASLAEILRTGPEARDLYLDYMSVHTHLRAEHAAIPASIAGVGARTLARRSNEGLHGSRPRDPEEAVSGQHSAVSQSSRHTPCAVTESEKTPIVRGPSSVVSSQLSVVEESPSISSQRTTDNGPLTTPSIPQSAIRNPHSFSRQPLAYSCFVATVATVIILMIASQIPVGSLGGLAGKGGSGKVGDGLSGSGLGAVGQSIEYVARFTNGSDYVWDMPDWEAPWRGGGLEKGKEIRMKSGLAEFTFASGAKTVVEGPAYFVVEGEKLARLELGKIVARVEKKEAAGFTVKTPTATIVDLGTEFGVEVGDHALRVHVFSGKVEVNEANSNLENRRALELATGEAVEIDRDRQITRSVSQPDRFPSFFPVSPVREPGRVTLLADNFTNTKDATIHGNLAARQGRPLAPVSYLLHRLGNAEIVEGGRLRLTTAFGLNSSSILVPNMDFAMAIPFEGIGSFVVEFEVNPVVGGNGKGPNWAAVSIGWNKAEDRFLESRSTYVNGGGSFAPTDFGILFGDDGTATYFNKNRSSPKVPFDGEPRTGDKLHRVKLEFVTLNFLPATPYKVFAWVDGKVLDLDGTTPGVHVDGAWDSQGTAYIVFETRGTESSVNTSDFDNLHIYYTTARAESFKQSLRNPISDEELSRDEIGLINPRNERPSFNSDANATTSSEFETKRSR